MAVQIVSIVLSSLTAIIAIIISIISIDKQTKSQNINATIQLFDKRFEIYLFTIELWYIIGYFEGGLDNSSKNKHTYAEILSYTRKVNLNNDIRNKIDIAYEKSQKYKVLHKCLFEGSAEEYLERLISAFSTYITGIYYGKSIDSENEEKNYQTILKLIKSKDFDMQNLRQYIDLSDIKRLDIKN